MTGNNHSHPTHMLTMPNPIRQNRRTAYEGALSFEAFLAGVRVNEQLWTALARRASVSDRLVRQARAIPGSWHLLALVEDWCGDAVNTLPVLSRLVEQAPHITLRVLKRDDHPDLMDAHLTHGKRAIPIMMVLDDEFREVAWWGPRPAYLQDWATTLGMTLSKPDRYRELRRWYAVDRGQSTVREVLRLMCQASGAACERDAA